MLHPDPEVGSISLQVEKEFLDFIFLPMDIGDRKGVLLARICRLTL